MLRTVVAIASILISLPLLALEHSHVAHLDGGEEVPPNFSTATGFAVLTLEEGATRFRISYSYEGIASGVTGGHIHGPAAAGTNAGILFNLAPPADAAAQVLDLSFPIDATGLQDLRDGQWYVNLHSTSFPDGEIRGQLLREPGFDARLDGAQETPPVASSGHGTGRVNVSEDGTLLHVLLGFEGLGSAVTLTHIHGPAERGLAAGVLFNLEPDTGVTSDRYSRFFDVGAADLSELEAGLWYLNVHTETFGGGEIRGQLDIIFEDGLEIEPTPGL